MKKKILLPIVIVSAFLILAIGAVTVVESYRSTHFSVSGPNMEPAIKQGTNIAITKYKDGTTPARGDIVLFNSDKGKLVQRVIALPGERVVIKDGVVLVYNSSNPEGFTPEFGTITGPTAGSVDSQLAGDEYFVLGDNRPNAYDSRIIGAITLKSIVGQASISTIQAE